MKKIVGIIAAVAMATSVFAADVSAAIQGYGDLFSMEFKEDAKPNVLGWNDPWDREFSWYSTGLGFTCNGDRAGLSFELDNRDVTVKASKFWIQPLDMLKIQLGNNTIETSKETIDYAGTVFSVSGYEGWYFELKPVDGLTFQLGLDTAAPSGWSTNYWWGNKNYDGGDTRGAIIASAGYGADFGTITAYFKNLGEDNTVAINYDGNFGGVFVSPAFAFEINAKKLAADLFVTANAAGVGINVYAKVDVALPQNDGDDTTTALAFNSKFTYGVDIGQLSLQFKDDNFMAEQFACMIKANLGCNCGSAGLDIGLQFDIGATTKMSVPFQYNIHF